MLLDYFEISNSPKKMAERFCRFYTTGSAKLLKEIAEDWLPIDHIKVEHIDLGGV